MLFWFWESIQKTRKAGIIIVKRKGLSFLLSAVIVCSSIFTGCASEDTAKTKEASETTSKEDENSSDNKKKEDVSEEKKEDDSSGSAKEDSSSDTDEEISSGDDEKGLLSKIADSLSEKADEMLDDKNEEKADTKEKDGKYHPGDVVSFGDFKITYKYVKKYQSKNEFIQPQKGFQYVQYSFTFKNIGKEDAYVGDFSCYANGEKCEDAYVNDSDSNLFLTELSAGRKKSGSVIFEVPKKAKLKDLELEYENNSFWSDEKIIFLGK